MFPLSGTRPKPVQFVHGSRKYFCQDRCYLHGYRRMEQNLFDSSFARERARRVAIMAAKYFSLKSNEWITIVLEITPHFQPTWTRNLNFPSFYCFYYDPFFFLSFFRTFSGRDFARSFEISRILEIHLNLGKLCYTSNDFKCYLL